MQAFNLLKSKVRDLIVEEDGQDGIEYLLVVGGISVVIVIAAAAVATGLPSIVDATCEAVDGAIPGNTTAISC